MNKIESIQRVMDAIGQASLLWSRLRRAVLEKQGLTLTDKRILYGLYREHEMTKKELAQAVVLEHSSLTRSLARLESRGLITRVSNEADKRYITLGLTEKGLALTQLVRSESFKIARQLLSFAKESQLQQVTDFMNKFKVSMEEMLKAEINEK